MRRAAALLLLVVCAAAGLAVAAASAKPPEGNHGNPHTTTVTTTTVPTTTTVSTTTVPTTTVTTTTASTAWPHGGIGIWRVGDNLPSTASRYDIVIVAGWQADLAGALPSTTKSLLYTSDVSCDTRTSGTDYFYGMSATELRANNWYLKDASGREVHSNGYPNSVLADIGLTAYQDKWARNVEAFLVAHHLDGLQVDDVDGTLSHYASVSIPKYPTNQSWQDAHVAFLNRAVAYLRSKGYWVVANTAGTTSFLTRVAQTTNAVMLEDYRGTSADVQAVNAGGAIAAPLAFSNPSGYRATFKTVDRGDGIFLYEPSDRSDPWGTWATSP